MTDHERALEDAHEIASHDSPWYDCDPQLVARDLIAQSALVDELQPQLKTVLDREAKTHERHDKKVDALEDRVRVLEAALTEAIDDIEEWGAYASDYFKDKHGLAECVAKHRAALASKEG
jgi:hypothetical protein